MGRLDVEFVEIESCFVLLLWIEDQTLVAKVHEGANAIVTEVISVLAKDGEVGTVNNSHEEMEDGFICVWMLGVPKCEREVVE